MVKTSRWLCGTFAILTGITVSAGCENSRPPGADGNEHNTKILPNNACSVEGEESACAVELGRHDGIVSCAKGTRRCTAGAWGPCQVSTSTAQHYTVPEPAPSVGDPYGKGAGTGAIKGLTIAASSQSCTDNPCDPYCQKFPDTPDAALTGDSEVTYPDKNLTLTELPNGNPPDGFVKKGNDDNGVCGGCYPASYKPYSATQSCQEACQFDSHCAGNGANGCVSFSDSESGGCTGIDITSPLICQIPVGAPTNVGQRKLAVCNRGTADVPANSGIVCWKFPGGSPQYPNNDPLPGANNSAGPVDTFNEAIPAGTCITHVVDDAVFGNAGNTSVMCNVRQQYDSLVFIPSAGDLPTNGVAPTANTPDQWVNPTDAYDVGNNASTLTFTRTSVSAGPAAPAAVAGWSNLTNIGQTADTAMATVALANGATANVVTLTGFNLGSLVPAGSIIDSIRTTAVFARTGGDASKSHMWTVAKMNATSIADSSVAPSTDSGLAVAPATTTKTMTYTNSALTYTQADLNNLSVEVHARADNGGGAFTGSVDSVSLTVRYLAYTTSTIDLRGFSGFNVPALSSAVSVTVQVNWSATNANTKLCFQAYDTSANALIGSPTCTTTGATPTVLTTAQASIPVTVNQANNLAIQVTGTHTLGQATSTATLDYVSAQLKYLTPPQLTGVDECNINNNWTVSKRNPPLYCPAVTVYYDFTTTRVFDGVCPAGTRTRWRLFGWDSSTPNSTKIEFRFRAYEPTALADGGYTCDPLAAISSSPPAALATAQSTPTDTQVCSVVSTPSGSCPGDLETYLGGAPTSDLRCLQMDAHGYADSLGAPTLNGWTATYDCLPSE
jgi:hypothetical protein